MVSEPQYRIERFRSHGPCHGLCVIHELFVKNLPTHLGTSVGVFLFRISGDTKRFVVKGIDIFVVIEGSPVLSYSPSVHL